MCIFMIAGCGKKSLTKTDGERGTNNVSDADEEDNDTAAQSAQLGSYYVWPGVDIFTDKYY